MKTVSIILILLFNLTALGQVQKKVMVVNGLTNKPVKGVYCYTLKNNDKWIDICKTNEKGILTAKIQEFDKAASYQIDITGSKFKPVRQPINLLDKKKLIIKIYPDSTFVERITSLVYLECSSISFGFYYPKEPNSLFDLPDSIRTKLTSHLIDRLGSDFYSKIKISGGQVVDLDRLYLLEENARDYKWIPYSYYLCFSLRDTTKGIGLYTAKIVLDKHGNVIEEIQFPDIKTNPEKSTIISIEQAKAVAKENNFYSDSTSISLSFDKKNGSIIWCFKQVTHSADHTLSGWTLAIDAHNGKVIGKYGIGGIWD